MVSKKSRSEVRVNKHRKLRPFKWYSTVPTSGSVQK